MMCIVEIVDYVDDTVIQEVYHTRYMPLFSEKHL